MGEDMDFNLEKLKDYQDCIGSISSSLKSSYNSTWKDSVHDSFGAFIEAHDEQTNKFDSLMTQLRDVCDSLRAVNINELSDTCNSLLLQID